MKNTVTAIILHTHTHTHTHTQRNTLSKNLLEFKLALGVKRCQGFLKNRPKQFSEINAENKLGFFISGR